MIHNHYSALHYIAEHEPEKLQAIINQYGRQRSRQRSAPSQNQNCQFTGFIVARPQEEEIKLGVKDLLEVMDDDSMPSEFKSALTSSMLSPAGWKAIWKLVSKYLPEEAKQEIINVMTADENLTAYYNGKPKFKIVVTDEPDKKNKDIHKYRFILRHQSIKDFELKLTGNYAPLIFEWFLLNPCREFSKNELIEQFDDFEKLALLNYGFAYENIREFKKRLNEPFYGDMKNKKSNSQTNKTGFDMFFTDGRNQLNKDITAFMKKFFKDSEETAKKEAKWYMVNDDKKDKTHVYAISLLPDEIELPDSLKKFHEVDVEAYNII